MGKFLFFKGVVFSFVFSFLSNGTFADTNKSSPDEPSDCAFSLTEQAAAHGGVALSESEVSIFWQQITQKLKEEEVVGGFSGKEVQRSLARKSFDFGMLFVRRVFVIGLGVGAVIGTGTLANQYTNDEIVATGLMLVTTEIFKKLLSPLDRRLGPVFEKFGHRLWGPGQDDIWGRVMSALNDNEREISQQIYSQLLVVTKLFDKARKALKKGKISKAAKKYISIFLLSKALFAMLHLDDLATLVTVQSEIPKNLSSETVEELLKETIRNINLIPLETFEDLKIKREEFRGFVVSMLRKWFTQTIIP